jgi:hypothetical protein
MYFSCFYLFVYIHSGILNAANSADVSPEKVLGLVWEARPRQRLDPFSVGRSFCRGRGAEEQSGDRNERRSFAKPGRIETEG